MKKIKVIFFVAMLGGFCHAQEKLDIEKVILDNNSIWFNSWKENPMSKVEEYSKHKIQSYEYDHKTNDIFDIYSPSKNKFVYIYSRIISISQVDGKSLISYGDPDSEIILVDKEKKMGQRIFYNGSSMNLDDVIWISDSYFLVLGSWFENKKEYPIVMIFNLNDFTYIYYRFGKNKMKYDYLEQKFNKMKISTD